MKGGTIVTPSKLTPDRRDAICMQCHMEGRVFIERAGRHIYDYRPGDSLADYVRYYVLAGSGTQLGAVSQVEVLAQSTCKRKSGDAMSCTSCHDPHFSPPPHERAAYFPTKCLACHGKTFAAKHHPEQQGCTACHMPASSSKDVAHTQVTDHRIPCFAALSPDLLQDANKRSQPVQLVPFPETAEAETGLRDLALAWESVANRGMEAARPNAREMLRRSAAEQRQRMLDEARVSYRRALAEDHNLIDAAVNLGVIEAQNGNYEQAAKLLKSVFDRTPGRSAVGMNLVQVLCAAGKRNEALSTIARVLDFNPDLSGAKKFMADLRESGQKCSAK